MVWIFKIITHRLLSVLKRGGCFFFKKKEGLAVPPTGWKLSLEIFGVREEIGRVWGKRRNRLGDLEWGSQGERAGDLATSPGGVKLLKKKKKRQQAPVLPLQINAEGHPAPPPPRHPGCL